MKATVSTVAGLCEFEANNQRRLVNVLDMSFIDSQDAHLACSNIDDWESIDEPDFDAILVKTRSRHLAFRCLLNIECCLIGVSEDVQKDLIEETESHLKAYAISDMLRHTLLRA